MSESDSENRSNDTSVLVPKIDRALQEKTVVVLSFSPKKVRRWIFLLLFVLIVPPATYYFRHFYIIRRGLVAQTLVSQGLGALALDWIDSARENYVSDPGGCLMLLKTYELSFRLDRLHWAAEACKASGVKLPEVHQALGQVYAANGKLDDARIEYEKGAGYRSVSGKVRLAEFLFLHGTPDEAIAALENGKFSLPDEEDLFNYHLIRFYSRFKRYKEAAELGLASPTLYRSKKFPEAAALIEDVVLKRGGPDAMKAISTLKGPPRVLPGFLKKKSISGDAMQLPSTTGDFIRPEGVK